MNDIIEHDHPHRYERSRKAFHSGRDLGSVANGRGKHSDSLTDSALIIVGINPMLRRVVCFWKSFHFDAKILQDFNERNINFEVSSLFAAAATAPVKLSLVLRCEYSPRTLLYARASSPVLVEGLGDVVEVGLDVGKLGATKCLIGCGVLGV
ncbi:hypothetical protein EVAR_44758_1 [Eumeta japonica]|uniref:Uncharacterized protein n=1 Tax=Eumeta variegata TaxID=151549 RepID=A0A4C1XGH4_EUMVA|nr:hypothetical protein EVAR_44758_1 [Eumeta japonica]